MDLYVDADLAAMTKVYLGDISFASASHAGDVRVERVTLRDRFLSRARVMHLDRQLAGGASPDTSAVLSLRARLLVQPAARNLLAQSVAAILKEAAGPLWPRRSFRVAVARGNVREASAGLEALAVRLWQSAPVSVQGVAAVELLLRDGTGPVYNTQSRQRLDEVVDDVLRALEPRDSV